MRFGSTSISYAFLGVVIAFSQAIFAQKVPSGLWQSKEEGFVIKIVPCGTGFCGYAIGLPVKKDKGPKGVCGKQIWSNFVWNRDSSRWEGTMNPPDINKSLKAFIRTDTQTLLSVTARIMFLTKTMHFTPFVGAITESCEIKP